MTDEKKSEEERFYDNIQDLTQFINTLAEFALSQGYKSLSPNSIKLAAAMLGGFKKSKLLDTFITYSHKYWPNMMKKEREYFIQHSGEIFGDLPSNYVKEFSSIFEIKDNTGQYLVNSEDIDCIADFFFAMVRIAIIYIHKKRKPYSERIDNSSTLNKYTDESFFKDVDIIKEAKEWGVTIEFPLKS